MFKKYTIKVRTGCPDSDRKTYGLDFFVHSRGTRSGFCHEAVVIGCIPVKDGCTEPIETIRSDRRVRKNYLNRTWESWNGQDALRSIWNKMMSWKWVDKERLPKKNPFDSDKEPKHESLWDPDELFRRDW